MDPLRMPPKEGAPGTSPPSGNGSRWHAPQFANERATPRFVGTHRIAPSVLYAASPKGHDEPPDPFGRGPSRAGGILVGPLTALSATQSGLVEFSRSRITVVQDGVSSGRTIEDPAAALMWVGLSANGTRLEDTLIRVLNGVDH